MQSKFRGRRMTKLPEVASGSEAATGAGAYIITISTPDAINYITTSRTMRQTLLDKSKHYRASVAEPSIFGPVHRQNSYQGLSKKLKVNPRALAFIGDPSAQAQGQ